MMERVLGTHSPLRVSSVGLGCMGMVSAYPPIPSREDMVRLSREAFEAGETFFDTAEVYGPFTSEEILGEALSDVRNQVQLATKFGFNIREGKSVGLDSRPETIRKAVEGSLRRLKTDHIDLLYQHRADPNVPVEAVAETVARLMEEGKVLHWGMSEVAVRTVKRAHELLPLTAVQYEYSMWHRDVEKELLPLLKELGIGLVCFCPLGRGYLTGNLTPDRKFMEGDVRGTMPRFESPEMLAENQQVVMLIQRFAEEISCTPAQIALAWLLRQYDGIVPIPGTTKISRVKENLQAAKLNFASAEWDVLDRALEQVTIVGARYNSQQEALTEK